MLVSFYVASHQYWKRLHFISFSKYRVNLRVDTLGGEGHCRNRCIKEKIQKENSELENTKSKYDGNFKSGMDTPGVQ